MKKIIFFVMSAFFVANTVVAADRFVLNVKVDSILSGTAVLSFTTFIGNQFKKQEYTSEIKQGHFRFVGELKEPINAELKIDKIRVTLYIEPANMELYIPKTYPYKFVMKGSKVQEDEELYLLDSKDLYDVDSIIYSKGQKIDQLIETTPKTDPNFQKLVEERKLISSQKDSAFSALVKRRINYIKSHPSSYQSVVDQSIKNLLMMQVISVDSARILFNQLAEKVRISTSGRETDTYIKKNEKGNITIGRVAPDFNTPDMNGKMIKLSDFREKSYVLLDFWASWCVPCVKSIPHMKTLYTKYHDKGFEIISITKDDSRNEWIDAIQKHGIAHWYQISAVQNMEKASQGYIDPNNISDKYPTVSIPLYILIDKAGKIIATWNNSSEENENKQDNLLKEIFGE